MTKENNLILSEEEKSIIKTMGDRPSSFEEIIERSGMKSDMVSNVIDVLLERKIVTERIPIKQR